MSSNDQSKALPHSTESIPNISEGWISEEDGADEPKGHNPVKSDNVGPLLAGFADAATMD
jgi:hypothetical protein